MVVVRGGGERREEFLHIMTKHAGMGAGGGGMNDCDAFFAGFQGGQPYCFLVWLYFGLRLAGFIVLFGYLASLILSLLFCKIMSISTCRIFHSYLKVVNFLEGKGK